MGSIGSIVEQLKGVQRPGSHEYFLAIAALVATRATCARRRVGCVFTDQFNHIIATGYNGVAAGLPHCTDHPCPGANMPSGTGLSVCEALHAEENALIQLRNPQDLDTVYSTASPCILCIRRLLNTPAKTIVFSELYPHPESQMLWQKAGRKWFHHPMN